MRDLPTMTTSVLERETCITGVGVSMPDTRPYRSAPSRVSQRVPGEQGGSRVSGKSSALDHVSYGGGIHGNTAVHPLGILRSFLERAHA